MSQAAVETWGISERAAALHRSALVWDDHGGFGYSTASALEGLERWRTAGIDYLSINAGYDVVHWTKTLEATSQYRHWIRTHPELFVQVERVADIHRARKEGKLAVTFDLEGMIALNGDIGMVDLYYRLGVRQMLFAYNRSNLAGGGCHDEDPGLTAFGRRVDEEMNRVGMLVDCSHTGYRTTMDVMNAAAAPVIFSHSNPKALHKHGRNILDEQIRACALTGGVVGINGIGLFLPDRQASTKSMVDCICYVADMIGTDHVGIGLDYTPESLDSLLEMNPLFWPPSEGYGQGGLMRIADPNQLPEITDKLMDRGWAEADIRKLLGGNFLRVASAVWK